MYQIRCCLIHSGHLPRVIVVKGVTMELLEDDEKLGATCVLPVKVFGVLDSLTT